MPKILQLKECPACGESLPQPTPRVCPGCAKSLQQRFLSFGCLTSAPPLLLGGSLLVGWLLDQLSSL